MMTKLLGNIVDFLFTAGCVRGRGLVGTIKGCGGGLINLRRDTLRCLTQPGLSIMTLLPFLRVTMKGSGSKGDWNLFF